jgi:hypothetical protein
MSRPLLLRCTAVTCYTHFAILHMPPLAPRGVSLLWAEPECNLLLGEFVIEILGAAVGMLVGAVALAIALWEFPKFRHAFFSDYTGLVFIGFVLLGGWIGYWIVGILFLSK